LRHILEGRYQPGQLLPTIHELADILQVSTKTVQKAVHGLSAEGLIVAKRGVGLMVKDTPARRSRWKRVGLLYPHGESYLKSAPYPASVIQAFEKELQNAGLRMEPCALAEIERLNLLEVIAKKRLNAMVFFEIDSDPLILELRETRLPMVSLDYDAYRHGVSSVIFDNIHGTFQATKNLISLGHRRIAFLRPMLKSPIGAYHSLDWVEEERVKGYRLAMQDAGLPALVCEYKNNPTASEMLTDFFSRRPTPTAAVCVSDASAAAIAAEAQKQGRRVPDEFSIVGFGGESVKLPSGITLSSVRVEYAEMGRLAAQILLQTMDGKETGPRRELLPARLSAGQSVAAPSVVLVN
jgi:DNA-binding LacI/PurR family transcriptional regulator